MDRRQENAEDGFVIIFEGWFAVVGDQVGVVMGSQSGASEEVINGDGDISLAEVAGMQEEMRHQV